MHGSSDRGRMGDDREISAASSQRITRRRILQAGAVVGGAAWVAPIVDSFASPAAAGSCVGGRRVRLRDSTDFYAITCCGPSDCTGTFWELPVSCYVSNEGPSYCAVNPPEHATCTVSSDCGPGQFCSGTACVDVPTLI